MRGEKKRETVEKFYSMKCVGMLLLPMEEKMDRDVRKGVAYSERIS